MGGSASKLWIYIPAQLIGAIIVWVHYMLHWRATEDASLELACFCTGPAIRDLKANRVSEIIGTFVLMMAISALTSKTVGSPTTIPAGLSSYLVGVIVRGVGLSLGGTTGYAINSARDFGPRLAHAVLPIHGKAGSDRAYASVPNPGAAGRRGARRDVPRGGRILGVAATFRDRR